jgi:hypothetical protein
MTAFQQRKATRAELLVVNNWRIYYKVILLLDLCFATGKGIQPILLENNHSTLVRQSSSTLHWPKQGKPDVSSFKVWKRFLKKCFINPDIHQLPSMGPWNIDEVLRITPRYGYYSKIEKEIYILAGSSFHTHEAYDIGRTSARFDPNQSSSMLTILPADSIPVDIYLYPISTLVKFDIVATNQQNPTKDASKWGCNILRHFKILDITKLRSSLENKNIETNIASDGGVHNYQSIFGLVITSKSDVVATNKGKIYSIKFHESFYCSELFGILAALVSLRHIISSYNMTIPRQKDIFLYCDNKSVVPTINS